MNVPSSEVGVTDTSIKVGFLTSLTGIYGAAFGKTADAAKARAALQNDEGGVCGRKIDVVVGDDGSSPTQVLTAAQNLVENQKVFSVATADAFLSGAYKYLRDKNVPVTGGLYSGPEWLDPANLNMFSMYGTYDPKFRVSDTYGQYAKSQGVTKFGVLAFSGGGIGAVSARANARSVQAVGIPTVYTNVTIPVGSVDFGAVALDIKASGIDGFFAIMNDPSDIALLSALKAAGVHLKMSLFGTGYGQTLLDNATATAAAQGTTFVSVDVPVALNTPATQRYQAALAKYAKFTGTPGFQQAEGWDSMSLMIRGIKESCGNVSRAGFIQNLHKVTDYTNDNLYSGPVDFSVDKIGTLPHGGGGGSGCWYAVKLQGKEFVPVQNTPFCGKDVPGSEDPG